MTNDKAPAHINPAQWAQALGFARQAGARVFRDGGTARDAALAFGVTDQVSPTDWSRAITLIAEVMCSAPAARAA
ncbi:MAG: hypothetical protein AAFR75_12610, partial [Pseudomonadota bacterium]